MGETSHGGYDAGVANLFCILEETYSRDRVPTGSRSLEVLANEAIRNNYPALDGPLREAFTEIAKTPKKKEWNEVDFRAGAAIALLIFRKFAMNEAPSLPLQDNAAPNISAEVLVARVQQKRQASVTESVEDIYKKRLQEAKGEDKSFSAFIAATDVAKRMGVIDLTSFRAGMVIICEAKNGTFVAPVAAGVTSSRRYG